MTSGLPLPPPRTKERELISPAGSNKIMDDNKLITLKEASQLSGYSADYIGQLIRAGKIPGKQVYCNIAWMTTAEAVMEYKNKGQEDNGKKSFRVFLLGQKRKMAMQMNIIKLFFQTFKSAVPVLILVIASFLALSFYLVYSAAHRAGNAAGTAQTQPAEERNLSY